MSTYICPRCHCQMTPSFEHDHFDCPGCNLYINRAFLKEMCDEVITAGDTADEHAAYLGIGGIGYIYPSSSEDD